MIKLGKDKVIPSANVSPEVEKKLEKEAKEFDAADESIKDPPPSKDP